MTHWTWQFSLPQAFAEERIFDTVIGTHGRAIATWLVTTYPDQIARASEGLSDVIIDWTQNQDSSATAWDPAFGRAQFAFKSHKPEPVEVATRLALRLTEQGHPGPWRATLPPATMRLGSLLLTSVREIQAHGNGALGRVTMQTADGKQLVCVRDGATGSWQADGVERLPSVGVGRPIHLLPAYALPAHGQDEEGFVGATPVACIDDGMMDVFGEGARTIAECAAEYLPWIERVLRGIVVCPAEASFRVVSGSGEDAPGLIHVSYPLTPMDVAELLVHECAHQYFYMLQRVGPVDDGTDTELYWSPPIRMNRPLSRILMAYHALANVRLFYESVRAGGGSRVDYVDANERDMTEAVAALDVPLRGNQALTALGRGLYEPLAERLASLPA